MQSAHLRKRPLAGAIVMMDAANDPACHCDKSVASRPAADRAGPVADFDWRCCRQSSRGGKVASRLRNLTRAMPPVGSILMMMGGRTARIVQAAPRSCRAAGHMKVAECISVARSALPDLLPSLLLPNTAINCRDFDNVDAPLFGLVTSESIALATLLKSQ